MKVCSRPFENKQYLRAWRLDAECAFQDVPSPRKEILVSHAVQYHESQLVTMRLRESLSHLQQNWRTLKVPWTLFTRGADSKSKSNSLGRAQAGLEARRTAHTRTTTHTSRHTYVGTANKGQALRRALHPR